MPPSMMKGAEKRASSTVWGRKNLKASITGRDTVVDHPKFPLNT